MHSFLHTLISQGRPADQPVAFIENASTEQERIVESTLGSTAAGGVDVNAPAVIVIGEVVRHRVRFAATLAEGAFA